MLGLKRLMRIFVENYMNSEVDALLWSAVKQIPRYDINMRQEYFSAKKVHCFSPFNGGESLFNDKSIHCNMKIMAQPPKASLQCSIKAAYLSANFPSPCILGALIRMPFCPFNLHPIVKLRSFFQC